MWPKADMRCFCINVNVMFMYKYSITPYVQKLHKCECGLKVMEKEIAETEDIPIVVVTSIDIVSNIKGYHIYESVWTPTLQEQVYGEIEPHNPVDKYAVAVKID